MSKTIPVDFKPWGALPPGSHPYDATAAINAPLPPGVVVAEAIMTAIGATTPIEITSPVGIAGVYRMEQEPIPHAVEVTEEERLRTAA